MEITELELIARLVDAESFVISCEAWVKKRQAQYTAPRELAAVNQIDDAVRRYRATDSDIERLLRAEVLADKIATLLRHKELHATPIAEVYWEFYNLLQGTGKCDCCKIRPGAFSFIANRLCMHCLVDATANQSLEA